MLKPDCPKQLAEDLLARSICAVQVAAVLSDKWGIFGWGWNHSGSDGMGCHAEIHAISRANAKRLQGSTITIVGVRQRSHKFVFSAPCDACAGVIRAVGIKHINFRGKDTWNLIAS